MERVVNLLTVDASRITFVKGIHGEIVQLYDGQPFCVKPPHVGPNTKHTKLKLMDYKLKELEDRLMFLYVDFYRGKAIDAGLGEVVEDLS